MGFSFDCIIFHQSVSNGKTVYINISCDLFPVWFLSQFSVCGQTQYIELASGWDYKAIGICQGKPDCPLNNKARI